MKKILITLGAALALTAQAAGSFPDKAVNIIVPFPAGGSTDTVARAMALSMGEQLGKPFVVENRPGATGMIGMEAVAKAAPDGYTVGVMFLTHTVLPALFGKVPYDTVGSFAPIANLVWLYNALVVPAAMPAQNAREFIEAARAQPGKLTFGSGGNGSPAHLLGESFRQSARLDLLHVPFKGPAEAVQGLLGGHVSSMFATTSVAVSQVKAGRLRALAVTSPARLAALPEVPTLAEAGITGFDMKEWEGIVAPAGTPPEIIAQWNRELTRIMALPEVRERIAALGMVPAAANSADEFTALVRSELQTWTRFVRTTGIKAD